MKKVAPYGRSFDKRQSVHHRAHRVFADAVMQILSAGRCRPGNVRRPRRLTWSCSKARGRPSRRGTTEYFARARSALCPTPRGPPFPSDQREKQEDFVPPCRKFAALHQFDLVRQIGILSRGRLRTVRIHSLRASSPRCRFRREMVIHAVRHEKLRVFGPTVNSFGQPDFLLAQRFAVGFGRVLFVR